MIRNVTIIGGGIMGTQIALWLSFHDFHIQVVHRNENSLNKCKVLLTELLSNPFWKRLGEIRNEIIHTNSYADVSNTDLIIESISENSSQKEAVINKLLAIVNDKCIIASNSSTIPISFLVESKYHERVLNIHFFNPLITTRLCEFSFSPLFKYENKIHSFLEDIKFKAVKAEQIPGFLINRLTIPFWIDAINVFEKQNIAAIEYDSFFKTSLGHKMGPLETIDLVGIDTFAIACQTLLKLTKELRFAPPNIIERMCRESKLGLKTKIGFYTYN